MEIDWIDLIRYLRGFDGKIKVFRNKCKLFVLSDFFNNFLLLCVILNMLILASDGLIGEKYSLILAILNDFFTMLFLLESIIKLIGLGSNEFC